MKAELSHEDGYEGTFLTLLVQRHQAQSTNRLVTDTTCRLINVFLFAFVCLVGHLAYAEAVGVFLTTPLVWFVWSRSRQRLGYEINDIEESISRMSRGELEDLYIRSKRVSSGYRQFSLLRLEPQYWYIMLVSVFVVDLVTKGVGSWSGFSG